MELNREQAIEILERFDFFQGQRAGRELWNSKPFEVQEQDIANFSRDVTLLKNYIKELSVELEAMRTAANSYKMHNEKLTEENERLQKALSTDISIVRVSRGSGKTAHLREVGRIKVDAIRADTVRKMQERLTKEFDRMHKNNFMTPEVRQWIIDQIAKEMLEGGNGT